MKYTAAIFTIILLTFSAFGQPTNPPVKTAKKSFAAKKTLANEKEELEKAIALTDAPERIQALLKFVEAFPNSKEKLRASELVVSTRAALADEKLRAGEKTAGIELFKIAVRDAPTPISDKLFTEVVVQIPNSLFLRGEAAAAIEMAKLIEEKTDANAKQTLALAGFHLGMENGAEAKRLAGRAVTLEPALPAAYQTLGLAHRLDFELEESANAYAKAMELDAGSVNAKRSLAEMKRATGKTSEATALYREITASNPADAAAQTGLILTLLDAENKSEAESEMQKSLEANPNNLLLLVGAAYWYAAHNDGARAIELAEKAVAVEPRYTWARIALARGLMQQKRPLEAEKTLLAARQYGDFPTLDYELAAVRYQSGFYREAVETLQKKFAVEGGAVKTKLGGRVERTAKSFIELLAAERRASIFQTLAADNIEAADKLEALLDFSQKIESAADEAAINQAADEFARGDDRMKIHRQLFAANQLLEKRKSLPKVLELTKAAVGGVDAGLDVPSAAAAILADELYQSRRLAITRSELIVVPEVPRQTLSNIVRGKIEDTSGWALYQENKFAEAVTRLKRAVSVLPEKSAYWRSAMWRLGTAQDAAGNPKDALDAYVKSYTSGEPDAIRYGIIETAYQKVNGNTDGLEARIGAKPASVATAVSFPVSTDIKPIERTTTDAPQVTENKPEPAPTTEAKAETVPPPVTETPKAEVQPSPDTPSAEKSAAPEVKTETNPVETKTEANPVETKAESEQTETNVNPAAETAPKPLFEPVIINVPKIEPLKKATPETPKDETPPEPEPAPPTEAKTVEAETAKPETETPKVESDAAPIETKTAESSAEKKPLEESAPSRPRLIIENKLESAAAACQINVSQEKLSILSDGGNASILVGIESAGDAKEIKATSSNPADVIIVYEPEVTVKSGRQFFVVKSVSPAVGIYTITFEAPCGKKEVFVKVR